MSADTYLALLYENARIAVIDDAGHWKSDDLLAELVESLGAIQPPDVAIRLMELQAHAIVTRSEDARRPRRLKAASSSLYHPDAILKLGGDRVLMADATREDLTAWSEVLAVNLSRQSQAAAENLQYTATRLGGFRSGKYECLHDVEIGLFGWAPEDEEAAAS